MAWEKWAAPVRGYHENILKVEDNIIKDIKFKTFGCASAIASSSIMTENGKGQDNRRSLALTNKDVVDALGGLHAGKGACSVLAEQAIQAAIEDYRAKKSKEQRVKT